MLENRRNNGTEEIGFVTFIPAVSYYSFESLKHPYILDTSIWHQMILGPQISCSDLTNNTMLIYYAVMTTEATWTTYGNCFQEKTSLFHSILDG